MVRLEDDRRRGTGDSIRGRLRWGRPSLLPRALGVPRRYRSDADLYLGIGPTPSVGPSASLGRAG